MVNANSFCGSTDSEILEKAIQNRQEDGIVLIPPREASLDPQRKYWLLDRAILLPENTTVILQNCKLKLSDRCRDNFFRSANCGFGFPDPAPIQNIHIRGEGLCTLEGADRPRATGDGSKRIHNPCPHLAQDICRIKADWVPTECSASGNLDFWDIHAHSYGTDAGKEGESQYGDWRGIGILFANVENFSIQNIRIVNSHGWGISLEACSFGTLRDISFDAQMSKEIDGMRMNMENQDGIDIRNGCHHITISDIFGQTGDDVIALTAYAPDNQPFLEGGSLRTTHVMPNDWTKRERDIHDIIIRNVIAHSFLCFVIRLLPVDAHIHSVVIDNVVDTCPDDHRPGGTILLGDSDLYGTVPKDGLSNISISNVICNSKAAICLQGYLKDSVICNVINRNQDAPTLAISRDNAAENVKTINLL